MAEITLATGANVGGYGHLDAGPATVPAWVAQALEAGGFLAEPAVSTPAADSEGSDTPEAGADPATAEQ